MLMWFVRQMLPPNGFDQRSFFIDGYLEPGNVKKKQKKNYSLKLVFKNKKNLLFSSQRNNQSLVNACWKKFFNI